MRCYACGIRSASNDWPMWKDGFLKKAWVLVRLESSWCVTQSVQIYRGSRTKQSRPAYLPVTAGCLRPICLRKKSTLSTLSQTRSWLYNLVLTHRHTHTDQTWYLSLISLSGEKIVMWRNFSFPSMTIVGKLAISPHVEKFHMSPHDRFGEIWNSPHIACVWCRKSRHICNIYCNFCRFVAKSVVHAVLSQNVMCKKIEPKNTFVENKWQISGLTQTHTHPDTKTRKYTKAHRHQCKLQEN